MSLVLTLLLATTTLQTKPRFEVTQAFLDAAVATARPAVERELGYALGEGFAGARLATSAEIRDALVQENEPIMAAQLHDPELGRKQAQAFAQALAPALLAKYAGLERAVLISAEELRAKAELLQLPELESAEVLSAILVHELVHAADVPRYDFYGSCARLADSDRILALNAVLEGHAQHVARRVCAELGNAAGFETFTRAITAEVPVTEEEGEGVHLLRRMQSSTFDGTYVGGERFIAAVEAKAARDGIARAFREPPRDMAEIQRPEWYLDPALRPVTHLELERALDAFAAEYAERSWGAQRLSLDAGQLALAFAGFEDAAVERIRAALVRGRLLRVDAPHLSAMHYGLACEWASSADADFVLQASKILLKRRDGDLKQGAIRILEASYEPVAEEGLTGVYGRKRLSSFGQEVEIATAVLADGPMTLELLRSGEPGTRADLLALARRMLAAARVPVEPPPQAERQGSGGTGGSDGG